MINALREPNILITVFLTICCETIPIPILATDPHIRLLHVCQVWRDAMLSLPCLWDSYSFSACFLHQPRLQIDVLHYIIGWSGSNALTFLFPNTIGIEDHMTLKDNLFGGGRISIIDDIVSPYIDRIKFIRCLLNGNENRNFFLGIQKGAFSSLEGFDIAFINTLTHPYSAFTSQDVSNFQTFASLPRLRNVTCRIFNGISPLELNLPYSNLTSLDLDTSPISPGVFFRIMDLSRGSLIDAHFYVDFYIDLIDSLFGRTHYRYTAPVVMSSLSTLHLLLINSSADPDFILYFRFPLIQDLCVERAEKVLPFKWNTSHYLELLTSSAGLLKKLRLSSFAVDNSPASFHGHGLFCLSAPSDNIEPLFSVMPRLTELHLSIGIGIYTITFDKIARGELLPQLTAVDLTANIDPIPVIDMARTRNALAHSSALPPINHLSLTLPSTTLDRKKFFEKARNSLASVEECELLYLPSCNICG
ncbi:hypothetical protein CPB84DRAFT_1854191 [Gymnopilus junonius]|uniref:Uncharacterized protein n=1 Tax=Gymnopilus junonius TaxID=109634 RepID=A0A9P5N839_GYMJU|nr:hypothetical protein CPB84DRAFT_1854191 [Gymnopilus junonius]